MILAGDIGGTKTTLALFEIVGPRLRSTPHKATYPSRDHATFGEILQAFRDTLPTEAKVDSCCLGVAGIVMDGKVHTTNLPWDVTEAHLRETLKVDKALLLNDLESTAYGMTHLDLDQLHVLNPGTSRRTRGNVGVIAAGTGLGEATLFWDGSKFVPIASEGGHSDFAPRTEREVELWRFLSRRFEGHVSYERVLSGAGIANIYDFLRESTPDPEPDWLAAELAGGKDRAAVISKAGIDDADPRCVAALDLFAELYGAEAGNLALNALAVGGVFIGGGIAPRILPALIRDNAFLRGFNAKGRFTDFMAQFHVSVSLNPETALLGSAYYALEH